MKEIHLNFDLKFSPRFIRAAAVGAIVLAAVPEIGSESVTLATYYPAPSGVYTNMITTNNTYLARDGGNVGLGTTAPAYKLDVQNGAGVGAGVRFGQVNFSGVGSNSSQGTNYYALYQESGAWASPYPDLRIQYHTGIKYDAYYGYGGHRFYTGYDGTGNPTGLAFSIGDTVDQNVRVLNSQHIGGHLLLQGGSGCVVVDYNTSGTTTCAAKGYANHYATNIAGVMSKYAMMPVYRDVGGSTAYGMMLCCPCAPLTGGACPAL